ncbi:MAG TPA: hypothetical protein VG222_12510 [Vicinamibacterales bacterium]|nr:hypothetical protein [Vicinamibacterales bacterium]
MKRASKKAAPSFDVARDPIAGTQSGWVYRSDAQPSSAPSLGPAAHEAERDALHDAAASPVAPVPAARAPRSVPGNDSRFQPDAPPPLRRGWLATGIYLMALPMTLGMTLMFAPVSWMLGARSKR